MSDTLLMGKCKAAHLLGGSNPEVFRKAWEVAFGEGVVT